MLSKFLLYFNTIKYLKPVQIYGRLYSSLKKPFTVYNLPKIKLTPGTLINKAPFINHDPRNSRENINDNIFTFLNNTQSFGNNINWQERSLPLLWLFNLHYFAYLHLLDKSEQEKIIFDWIENNPIGSQPGWHPYTLSLRIVNWIKAGINNDKINRSLFSQCAYLYSNLEFYHPANHYLENAKALSIAGTFFKGEEEADKWYTKGIKIYQNKLPGMITDNGFFFELSPMYHLIILEGLLDILNIIKTDTKEYVLLKKYAEKMLGFLKIITHPNGEPVMFNDSTLEIAPSPAAITKYALMIGISSNDQTILDNKGPGLFSLNTDAVFLIIDGGQIGPDNIPAHSHADIFNYELSYKGKKIVTDSGVYEYSAGEMRDYCRSTMAHNTVSIDGTNQAEMWGSFRVARRYKPYDVEFKNRGNIITFQGKFDGYANLIGDNLLFSRKVEFDKSKLELLVEDEIIGSGVHKVESFIHLHPDVEIKRFDDYLILSIENTEIKLFLMDCKYSIESGWYCPEFGKRKKNKVIRIMSPKVPVKLTYLIKFH